MNVKDTTQEIKNFILKGDKDNNSRLIGYADKFEKELIRLTNSNDIFEAFSKVEPIFDSDEKDDKCICGHLIHYRFFAKNTETKEVYVIGDDCIEKFTRYNIVESGKFNEFVQYADSIIYLRRKVREVLKNDKKLNTLNRTDIVKHIKIANIKIDIPASFYDVPPDTDYERFLGAQLIIDLANALSIKNENLTKLTEWIANYEIQKKERFMKDMTSRVSNILEYPAKIALMNMIIDSSDIKRINSEIDIPIAYNLDNKPKVLAKLDNFLLLEKIVQSLQIDTTSIDTIKDKIRSKNPWEKKRAKQLYSVWKAICNKTSQVQNIKDDIDAINKDRDYFKKTKINRESNIKHKVLRYQTKSTLDFLLVVLNK